MVDVDVVIAVIGEHGGGEDLALIDDCLERGDPVVVVLPVAAGGRRRG